MLSSVPSHGLNPRGQVQEMEKVKWDAKKSTGRPFLSSKTKYSWNERQNEGERERERGSFELNMMTSYSVETTLLF